MDAQTEGTKPTRPWLRNNLVTLGSAAVFSVYGAGYFRTREAAERFAGESVQRRAAAIAPQLAIANPPAESAAIAHQDKPALPVMRLSSTPPERTAPAHDSVTQPSAATPADTTPSAAATPAKLAAPATLPAAAPPATPTPAPAAVPPAAQQATPVPSDSTVPVKSDEGPKLKDGVYYGWGTSRHGDIQASVEIRGGKIVGAYIAQCLTQYSCSWVSALPPEVVQRQSAEVDYVSGATQSSNAFYYAVMDALKKAK